MKKNIKRNAYIEVHINGRYTGAGGKLLMEGSCIKSKTTIFYMMVKLYSLKLIYSISLTKKTRYVKVL